MKNRSKYQRKIRISKLMCSILMVLLVCFMPIQMEGSRTFGVRLFCTIVMETGWEWSYILFAVYGVLAVFHFWRILRIVRGRETGWVYCLEKVSFGVGILTPPVAAMILSSSFQPGGTVMYVYVGFVLGGLTFLYCRSQETLEEKEEELEEERRKAEEKRRHQKQADYFPGRYPKEFYQVIGKMFRSRMKVQILMMLSEVFSAASLFIVLSMYGIMKETYALESGITGDGLYGLFRSLGVILIVLSILMMVLMAAWYMREVRKDYRLLVVLGIRSRTAYIQFLLEYWAGALISAVIGTGIGSAGAVILRGQLQKGMPEGRVLPEVLTPGYLGLGMLAYLILMLLALALNQENFLQLGKSVDRNEDLQRENRLKKGIGLWLTVGIVLWGLAVAWDSRREWAETLYIHILTVVGAFLLLAGGMALWLKRREGKAVYYTRLEKTAMLYHRFWSNTERLFLLAVIHILSLAAFAVNFAGSWMPQEIAAMYPYDIVVTAYEAEIPKLQETARKYDAQVCQYPMLRMTSIYGSEKLSRWNGIRPIQWPQGQQIAISESTYQEMREFLGKEPKPLHLKGEEVHVVYQQDRSVRAHTIEYDTARTEKHLRFGQPLEYYNTADFRKIFPDRTIVNEERDSLTGMFHQGKQDNLVVCSDAYFQENYDRITAYNRKNWEIRQQITKAEWRAYTITHPANLTEGPTMLFCMNLDDGLVDQAAADLEYLKEEHDFDTIWDNNIQPFYVKSQMIVNTESEIFFTKIANGFILMVLLFLGLFQYFVKVKSEEDTWRWENQFWKRLGMREKKRKAKLAYQMGFFLYLPMLSGVFCGVVFAALTAKARLYTGSEIWHFAGSLAAVYGIWCLVWVLAYEILKWNLWKSLERE